MKFVNVARWTVGSHFKEVISKKNSPSNHTLSRSTCIRCIWTYKETSKPVKRTAEHHPEHRQDASEQPKLAGWRLRRPTVFAMAVTSYRTLFALPLAHIHDTIRVLLHRRLVDVLSPKNVYFYSRQLYFRVVNTPDNCSMSKIKANLNNLRPWDTKTELRSNVQISARCD